MQVGYIYKHCTYTVCEMHIFTHTDTELSREVLVLQYLRKSESLFDFF